MGETLDENASVRVCADVHSLSLTVESEEGENHLVSHILVSFRATAVEPCQIHLPLDAYSTRTKVRAVTTPYSLCCEKGSESFCETLPMRIRAQEADPSPMAEILYVASDAQILECTAREAAIDVTLKLNVSLIGRDGCEVVGAESADGGILIYSR